MKIAESRLRHLIREVIGAASGAYQRRFEDPMTAVQRALADLLGQLPRAEVVAMAPGSPGFLEMVQDALDGAGVEDPATRELIARPLRMVPPVALLAPGISEHAARGRILRSQERHCRRPGNQAGMRVTLGQLRQVIRETLETMADPDVTFEVGDIVEEMGTDSGLWQIVAIEQGRKGPWAELHMVGGMLDRPVVARVPLERLAKSNESA